mgnify:CR=1 FL=1
MDSDIERLQQQINKLSNKLQEVELVVVSLKAAQTRARIFKLIYFGTIILLGIILYVYLKPFYQSLLQIYQFGSNQQDNIVEMQQNIDLDQIQDLINLFE